MHATQRNATRRSAVVELSWLRTQAPDWLEENDACHGKTMATGISRPQVYAGPPWPTWQEGQAKINGFVALLPAHAAPDRSVRRRSASDAARALKKRLLHEGSVSFQTFSTPGLQRGRPMILKSYVTMTPALDQQAGAAMNSIVRRGAAASAHTEIRQDDADDDDKADDVNDGVHDFLSGTLDAPERAPYEDQSWPPGRLAAVGSPTEKSSDKPLTAHGAEFPPLR